MWGVTPHFFYLILPYSYSVLFSVCILLFRKLKMGPSYSYSIFPRHISWIFSITVHSYCITHYIIHMCCSYILYAHCLKKNTQISQLSSSAYEHIPCGPVYFVSISPLPPSPPPDRLAGKAGVGGGGGAAGLAKGLFRRAQQKIQPWRGAGLPGQIPGIGRLQLV